MKFCIVDGLVDNKEKILSAVSYGIEQAYLFFRKVYNVDFPWLKILGKEEKFKLYANEVLDNWNNRMYSMLKKYSRASLYLPSQIDDIMEELKIEWEKE